MFFERAYSKDICIPGIENSNVFFGSIINEKLKSSDLVKLPKEDELRSKDIFKGELLLIKLHGSYNWVGVDGERAIIVGRNKERKIKKEPLLTQYFEKFKEVLFSNQRSLVIIGYSFYDDHINRVISDAMKNYGLKVYIVSPEPVWKLKEKISKDNEDLFYIYNGISGYFPYADIITGDPILYKPIKDYFNKSFFGIDK